MLTCFDDCESNTKNWSKPIKCKGAPDEDTSLAAWALLAFYKLKIIIRDNDLFVKKVHQIPKKYH